MAKSKTCKRCGKNKAIGLFPKDSKRPDKLSDWCKQCWKDYRTEKAAGKSTAKAKSPKEKRSEKAVAKPKASKSSPKSSKVDIGEVPEGIKVKEISRLADLPNSNKLFEWVGHGKIVQMVERFVSKFEANPTLVLKFKNKYFIETNIPVVG